MIKKNTIFFMTMSVGLFLMTIISCFTADTRLTPFDMYMQSAVDTWKFQGVVLVAQNDSILFRKAYGFADIANHRLNTPETKFLIGSTTKPFTAIATMQLYQQGLIELKKNISAYLPDYPKTVANRITIHHLLSHTSGIPDLTNNAEYRKRINEFVSADEITDYFKDLPLLFKPGEKYAYSSSNYVLLGRIIEKVSGLSWDEYIQKHICAPLDLHNTGVYFDYAKRSDFAIGYAPNREGILNAVPSIHPSCGYSAGSLASTVDDLYRVSRALDDTTLLNQATIDIMLTLHAATYGYGWLVDNLAGHRLTAHGGGVPGYVSIWQRWPDDSLCIIVMSNIVTAPVHTIATSLAAIALNEPYDLPVVKQPIYLSPEQLKTYEGEYQLESGEIRHIKLQTQHLTAQRGDGPPYVILPEANNRFFFAHDHMTTITFLLNSKEQVTAHVTRMMFGADTARKID